MTTYAWNAGNTKVHVIKKGPKTLCGIGKRRASAFGSKSSAYPEDRDLCGVCRLKLNGKKTRPATEMDVPSFIHIQSEEFLRSFEWRTLRYEVIRAYGAQCMACGKTPRDGAMICVDHIKPRRKYPELALAFNNLQVLCEECNHGKGNWDETDWRGAP
jgi:5-methylcytosine-specific restriction endonuclease McrA